MVGLTSLIDGSTVNNDLHAGRQISACRGADVRVLKTPESLSKGNIGSLSSLPPNTPLLASISYYWDEYPLRVMVRSSDVWFPSINEYFDNRFTINYIEENSPITQGDVRVVSTDQSCDTTPCSLPTSLSAEMDEFVAVGNLSTEQFSYHYRNYSLRIDAFMKGHYIGNDPFVTHVANQLVGLNCTVYGDGANLHMATRECLFRSVGIFDYSASSMNSEDSIYSRFSNGDKLIDSVAIEDLVCLHNKTGMVKR